LGLAEYDEAIFPVFFLGCFDLLLRDVEHAETEKAELQRYTEPRLPKSMSRH
jgi:hypothetical protein